MTSAEHWQQVYQTKTSDQLSWHQQQASLSLALIEQLVPDNSASIIDIGAGNSCLVDNLLEKGFSNITLVDIAEAALTQVKQRISPVQLQQVKMFSADLLRTELPQSAFELWHDRAVFHFLTQAWQRQAYIEQLCKSLKPQGKVIIASFAENGPSQCSGLPVCRYNETSLAQVFGKHFNLLASQTSTHATPWQSEQAFIYCCFEYHP